MMNKNQTNALAYLIFMLVSVMLCIYALYLVIAKGRYDAGTFFLLAAWILWPMESHKN